MTFALLLFSVFIQILCEKNSKIPHFETIENIDVLSVAYELTYNKTSVLKAIIKTINELESEVVEFNALLKSDKGKKEYELKCQNTSDTVIECYSGKEKFNLKDTYYFYYDRGENGKFTMDEKDVYEDYKKVSLIFKPEMEEDQIMYMDHKKIIGFNNRKVIGGGYLYLARKSKKLMHYPKDGFNKYIELNNFISHAGLYGQMPQSTLIAFKEAIRRGFHIVDADLQFTKDKVPVISHENDIEKISTGKGSIDSLTLKQLKKFDFGIKFDKKYKGEEILTFEDLLQLCKENEVIIDLDLAHLDLDKYFLNTDEYINIIIDTIEKYNMFDSIIFNDGGEQKKIRKLKEKKSDIAISLQNMNEKKNIEKIQEKYEDSKRIIYNMGGLSRGKTIEQSTVKYGLSLGKKIKAAIIDDLEFANKVQNWGVNYITTNKLHPFLIHNDKDIPIPIKCTQFDILADCRLPPEVKLIDNEVYNIYYTTNIYEMNKDIVDKPIGEFKYLDTKKLDDIFYTVMDFDFNNGYLKLNSSVKVRKPKQLRGFVGPAGYESIAPSCYQYEFICNGNDKLQVDCRIFKDNDDVVKFEGNYSVYSVENYSFYIPENKTVHKPLIDLSNPETEQRFVYISSIIIIIIATIAFIYSVRHSDNDYSTTFSKKKIRENSFIPETTSLNKQV